MSDPTVRTTIYNNTLVIELNRPDVRNAVDKATARKLAEAFAEFEANKNLRVAVFHGANGTFCAGADLKTISQEELHVAALNEIAPLDNRAPMGPSYMQLSKPVIGAVAGYAVAGGLELSLLCDFRVVEKSAVFGVFCRRWGVPLIDGGTVRLPRIVGMGNALDMILTGRPVNAEEAKIMGLANRLVDDGQCLENALQIAEQLSGFPQMCMLGDRQSAYSQWEMSLEDALINENKIGRAVIESGETVTGATRFASGKGRGGSFENI